MYGIIIIDSKKEGFMNSDKLCIEELKEKLGKNQIITSDEFYLFYKEIYPEIKKNTVRWNIYKLKEQKIIKNIARGNYVLEELTYKETDNYAVITMDIIGSSKEINRDFDVNFAKKINQLNNGIKKHLNYSQKFNISQGDELQILCPFDDRIGKLFLLTLSYLNPYKVRFAISIGNFINDVIDENSWNMNGPIFWNARDKLNEFKKSKSYDGAFISEYIEIDEICNKFMKALLLLINRVSEKQWEALSYKLKNYNLKDLNDTIGISQSSFYDRISSSNVDEILEGLDAIVKLMKIRRGI